MGEPIVKLDKPKQQFDKEEARDFMDEVWRYIDKLESTVMELEEGNQHWILLDEINRKKYRSLIEENENLKLKIRLMEKS